MLIVNKFYALLHLSGQHALFWVIHAVHGKCPATDAVEVFIRKRLHRTALVCPGHSDPHARRVQPSSEKRPINGHMFMTKPLFAVNALQRRKEKSWWRGAVQAVEGKLSLCLTDEAVKRFHDRSLSVYTCMYLGA